jgi:hypothetical protein
MKLLLSGPADEASARSYKIMPPRRAQQTRRRKSPKYVRREHEYWRQRADAKPEMALTGLTLGMSPPSLVDPQVIDVVQIDVRYER